MISIAQTSFFKVYSGYGNQTGATLIQCSDQGFLMVGYTAIIGGGTSPDIYVVKTDVWGNMEWNITFGGVDREYPKSVLQLADGGYIISGGMQNNSTSKYQVYVVRLDSSGNVLWHKKYGSGMSNSSMSYKICELNNGDFAIAGSAVSSNNSGEGFLFKLNNAGNVIWGKLFGGTGNDVIYSMDKTFDDGLILTGYTQSFGASTNLMLVKIDSSGAILWCKVFDSGYTDVGLSVRQTITNNIIITGYIMNSSGVSREMLLINTDSAGNLIWSKTYGGANEDFANVVEPTTDGGYVVAGYTASSGFGGQDMCVIKTNSAGDLLWVRNYGTNGYDVISDIIQTNDGGLASTGGLNTQQSVMALVKTDNSGNAGCIEQNVAFLVSNPIFTDSAASLNIYNAYFGTITYASVIGTSGVDSVICSTTSLHQIQPDHFSIFPNPVSKKLTINSAEFLENVSIEIIDMLSKVVLSTVYSNFVSREIDVESLIPGIYFLKVRYGNSEQVLKFVVRNE